MGQAGGAVGRSSHRHHAHVPASGAPAGRLNTRAGAAVVGSAGAGVRWTVRVISGSPSATPGPSSVSIPLRMPHTSDETYTAAAVTAGHGHGARPPQAAQQMTGTYRQAGHTDQASQLVRAAAGSG